MYNKEYSKEYYIKNKEAFKKRYEKNKEKVKERSKEYRQKNKEKYNIYQKILRAKKRIKVLQNRIEKWQNEIKEEQTNDRIFNRINSRNDIWSYDNVHTYSVKG